MFAAGGIQATPTRTICREAGVHQDAIHYHFGSKDQFVADILEAGIDRLDQRLAARLEQATAVSGRVSLHGLGLAAVAAALDMGDEVGVGRNYLPFIAALLADPRLRPLATGHASAWGDRMIAALAPLTPGLSDVERGYRVALVGFLLIHLAATPPGGLVSDWLTVVSQPREADMTTMLVNAVVGVLGGPGSVDDIAR